MQNSYQKKEKTHTFHKHRVFEMLFQNGGWQWPRGSRLLVFLSFFFSHTSSLYIYMFICIMSSVSLTYNSSFSWMKSTSRLAHFMYWFVLEFNLVCAIEMKRSDETIGENEWEERKRKSTTCIHENVLVSFLFFKIRWNFEIKTMFQIVKMTSKSMVIFDKERMKYR